MEDLRDEEIFIRRIKLEYEAEKNKALNKKQFQKQKMLEFEKTNNEKRSVNIILCYLDGKRNTEERKR